jgi:hypothetical protein
MKESSSVQTELYVEMRTWKTCSLTSYVTANNHQKEYGLPIPHQLMISAAKSSCFVPCRKASLGPRWLRAHVRNSTRELAPTLLCDETNRLVLQSLSLSVGSQNPSSSWGASSFFSSPPYSYPASSRYPCRFLSLRHGLHH